MSVWSDSALAHAKRPWWIEIHHHSEPVWDIERKTHIRKEGYAIHCCQPSGVGLQGQEITESTYCPVGKFGTLPDTFVGFHDSAETARKAVEDAGMADRLSSAEKGGS